MSGEPPPLPPPDSYHQSSGQYNQGSAQQAPPPPPHDLGNRIQDARESRALSQGYADINKLREAAAKWDRMAFKMKHKSAKYTTAMEKHRMSATVLREREQATLAKIPDLEAQMTELEKELQSGASGTASGSVRPRDQSKLHVRIRKLQEKIAGLQRKAKAYEHRASHHMAIAAQKKITSDMFLEKARQFEAEAAGFTARADRLQRATEAETLHGGGP